MKNFKRIVGLLLCLAMVLSFVPASIISVTAAENSGATPQNLVKSDILEKINLQGTITGACSQNNAADIEDLTWWTDDHAEWNKHLPAVDGNTSTVSTYNSDGPSERADWYLDLSKNSDGYTAVDKFVLYAGDTTAVEKIKVVFFLENGNEWEQTFNTNWDSADDKLTHTFDETINVTAMYVWQTENDKASLGEIELYQYAYVNNLTTAKINGVDLSQYKIVYSASDLDYAKTAAEYLHDQILLKTGRRVDVVTDATAETTYEILVGNTNRSYSQGISAPTEKAMKFTFASNGSKIAMKADYFIIAGAAYYFVETYIDDADFDVTVNTGVTTQNTITKPAKNYIMLIGDGMGVMQTRLWEKHGPSPTAEDDATYGYSDGENIFYGEYLPYKGFSKTANIYGTITDSAAGGTALATGYKTINSYVGRDQYENDITNLSELAWNMGKAVGIMSTEGSDGATPASFSAHTSGRYDSEVVTDQDALEEMGYVFVERYRDANDAYNAVFKTYTAEEFGRWDAKVKAGMEKVTKDSDGFFVMYEEAYIDKLCHALYEEGNANATDTEDVFRAMYRFNQHIAYFMEYAMYNPDTFVLITADHETGGLNENWEPTQFNVAPETGNDHSLQDVPVYVYGVGGEVFNGVTAENASIGRTFAHIMTNGNADSFGNTQFPILTTVAGGDPVELPAPTGLRVTATTDTTLTVTATGVAGGSLLFRINGGEWQSSGIFTGLTANTTYTIDAMYDASTGYVDSGITTITATTAEPAVEIQLEPVPTNKLTNAQFGYYGQNISGDITTHLYSDAYPADRVIDGADTESRSGAYYYSDLSGTLENQQKVPAIYIELTEAMVLGGVEIKGWEYDRYNMENFVVQIATEQNNDNWKTVAVVTQAFTEGDRGEDCPPLTVEFNKTYTAYKVRILVDSISDMSSEASGDDVGLTQYGYIRVKEVTPLYDPNGTVDQEPEEPETPTEPTTTPTQAPTQATEPVATKPATVSKLDLTDCDVYLGSMEEDSGKDFAERTWLKNGTTVLTDNDRSSEEHVRMWPGYRADCYVETGTAVFATQLQIHYSGYENDSDSRMDSDVPSLTVTLYLSDGSTETKEFADLDWNGKESGSVTWDFDGTYQVAGIYVWSPDTPDDAFTHFSLAEIELYDTQAGGETPEPTDPTEPTAPTTPTTPVATDPDALPDVVLKPVTNAPTPIVGYYSDKNTDGAITEYLNEDTNKGKVPAVLVDGKTGSSADYNWTGYYRYDEIASGAKIPVYLFEFDDPVAFTGVTIDTYKAMYYGMEDFTVQVYIEGKGWVTATTVADSFGAQTQEEYAEPITYPFAEPLYGTKIRILVNKLWDMTDWQFDDEYSFNLAYEASIRLREITLLEDPDYVPPVDESKKLKAPASLNTEFTDTTITAVAPPSTEYPEAEIRYAVYLDDQLVEANSTGIFTGLQPNTRYTVYAKYIGDGEMWQNSSAINNTTATDKLKLPTPNVEVDLTSTSITATADQVEGGTLEFRLLDENHIAIAGKGWSENNQFTGLTENTVYYIQARYNGDANHYDSEVAELEVTTGKILLSKPTLTVSGTTHNTITLNALAAVTGGSAEYSYSVDGSNWIVATGNVITGLTPETTYYLRARYVATNDDYNDSLYSEVVTATTKQGTLPTPVITVTATTDFSITVTAEPNANGTLMFRINGGEWQTSGEFTGLDRNTTYTIEAMYVANDGFIDSDVATTTATTEKTKLSAPTGLTVTETTDGSITVTADANANGTLKFRINGRQWQTSGEFTGLDRNTTYTIEAMYVANDGFIDSDATSITATTAKTQLNNPSGLTYIDRTANSITVQADMVTGGTLKFRIKLNGDVVKDWQPADANGRYKFVDLTSGTQYDVEAMYVADDDGDYLSSGTNTIHPSTLTILGKPDLSATSTDTTITATAPAVTGGTVQYRINGGAWQTSGTFTGLDWNTTYTIEAMYKAGEGYVDSGITTISVATTRPADPTVGDYAYLEAIPESGITPHVGYNNYPNHEMYAENTITGGNISDGMFGTLTQIRGDNVTFTNQDLAGYRRLSVVFDLNAGATKIGAVELTGGDYNLTKFEIQVLNTDGKWQTVKFVTNDLFDISDALKNDTVLITFTPVTGTKVRLMINGYEDENNPYNAPEIREMVVYEVKEDAQLEQKKVSTGTTAVFDGNKASTFTGTTATLNFNEPTGVKRLKLFGDTAETSIGAYTIKLQTTTGEQVITGKAFSGESGDNTCIVNLDKEYQVTSIQVIADKSVTIPEIEVYGYKGTFVPEAPDLPTETPTDAPERPTAVSPVQTSPSATQPVTVPTGDSGMADPEQVQPNVPAEGMTNPVQGDPNVPNSGADPEQAGPNVSDEGSDPEQAGPNVSDEGNLAATTPAIPTEPVGMTEPVVTPQATEAPVVMGWLDEIPKSSITPQCGYLVDGVVTDEYASEAKYINDGAYANGGYLRGTASDETGKTPVAVLNWGSSKLVGALEISVRAKEKEDKHLKTFDVQVYNGSSWETVLQITSDPFTTDYTVIFTFDKPVTATQLRILPKTWSGSDPMILEATVFEVKTSDAIVKIPVNSITVDQPGYAVGGSVANIIDGIKSDNANYYYYTYVHSGVKFTLNVANGGSPAEVKRIIIPAHGPDKYSPKATKIELETPSGTVTVFNGNAYESGFKDTFILDLDQTYNVTNIYVTVTSIIGDQLILNEIEVYGPGDGYIQVSGSGSVGDVGTTTVGSASYDKIPLSSSNLIGGCSSSYAARDVSTSTNFDGISWYFNKNSKFTRITGLVDGTTNPSSSSSSQYAEWGMDPNEGGDFYLKLSSATAIDQIRLYSYLYDSSSYVNPANVTVYLVLSGGGAVKKTFTTGWTNSTANGTVAIFDLGQTYTVTGVYVLSTTNTPAYENKGKISLAEVELYVKKDVQLDAPANLQATATTENSITVAANTLSPAEAGTLKFRINGGAWQTSGTFTGLTAGTTYTIDAMYDAATGYIDSGISTITVTTSVPVVSAFTVSGTTTAGATVQLCKGGAVKATATADNSGKYSFADVAIGNYTLVFYKTGYEAQSAVITVSTANVTKNVTLTQAVYTVSGTTNAGATVQLYKDGAVKQTTTADNSGKYSFSNVALENYTLAFTLYGYQAQTATITVNANVTKNVTLTQLTYTVSGTTTAGATVQLYKDGAVKETVTATNGSYSFTGVAMGSYTLVFTKYGYEPQTAVIAVNANVTKDVTLTQLVYTVSGTTTAGATVQLYKDGAVKFTATATNGSYSIANVPMGSYSLVITNYGYTPYTEVIAVNANVTKNVTLTQLSYTVSGTTTAGATVKLYQNGAEVATVEATDGSYSFSNLAMGNYTLLATKYGYTARTEVIIVNQNVTQALALTQITHAISGTVTGTTNDAATVKLYKNGNLVDSTTAAANGAYTFSGVAMGNYSILVEMGNHIAQSATVTVSGADVAQNFAMQPVPMNSTTVAPEAVVTNTSYNVRLYEPWALRVKVTFYTEKNGTAINISDRNVVKSYGAYAIIGYKYGDGTTAPTSWEDIISDPDAVQFKMADSAGDGNMFLTSGTTATFDFYDGLYTYRLAENVYWVAYYEDAEGVIHFTNVNKPVLMDKVENIITKISGDEEQDTQRIVLEHMQQLYHALIDFRGEDAELGNNKYANGEYLGNVNMEDVNTGTYQFGKSHKIRLIEPWSVKLTYQVRNKSTMTMLDFTAANVNDYGVIFYHDKTGEYYGNMTAAQMLERKDAVIYSKTLGNITLEDGKMVAVYDKGLFTYEMDSEIYCLPFVVVDGQYHYSPNANRIDLIDQMYAYYNNTTLKNEERATFAAMIKLYESTTIHRKKYGQ